MTVSIIIPIYNARRFIRQTAGDILRQTFRDIEVIFVDDGSDDGSGRILDRLAMKDERIRVIHQENGGTARARNAGIRSASGKYLMFMDDDDRIPRGYIEEYVSAIEGTDADIVMGGYRRITPKGRVLYTRRLVKKDRPVRSDDSMTADRPARSDDSMTADRSARSNDSIKADRSSSSGTPGYSWLAYINISPWAKIYRRSFVEESGAQFLEYSYGEDIYFHMMLLQAKPKIGYSSSVSYRWVDHKESISNTIHKGIRQEADIFPMLEKVLEVHPDRDEYFRYFMYRHCAYHIYVSGRDAGSSRLTEEFGRCREWLKANDLMPGIHPMSSKLEGEIFRDRIAVLVIRWTSKLHLEKKFAQLYCRGDSALPGSKATSQSVGSDSVQPVSEADPQLDSVAGASPLNEAGRNSFMQSGTEKEVQDE